MGPFSLLHRSPDFQHFVDYGIAIAVFAAMAATVTTQGIGILVTYGKYLVMFYLSLGVLWLVLIAGGIVFLGRTVFRLILLIREPFLLGFSTASSEAAYPVTMAQLEKLPVSKKIISFVLPWGTRSTSMAR